MASSQESPFKYLSYVTLREGWTQVKVVFVAWIIISAIVMAFMAFTDFGVKKTHDYWSILPSSVWYVLGFAAFTWIVRGEELRLAFPQSFKGWFLVNLGVALMVVAGLVLPSWALVPVYLGLLFFFGALEDLAAVGKSNYERLSGQVDGA